MKKYQKGVEKTTLPPGRSLSDPISRPPMYGSGHAFVPDVVPKQSGLRRRLRPKPTGVATPTASPPTPALGLPWTGRIHDDFMKMDSVVWWQGSPQTPFRGTDGDGTPIGMLPAASIKINFTVYAFAVSQGARVFAWIGDNVTGLATAEVTLLPLSTNNTAITFDTWPNPFPDQLYGHHQLFIELWEVSSAGAPLPAAYQAVANDARLFRNVASDWSWVYVGPGCKNGGPGSPPFGIDFLTVNSMAFSFSSTPVKLDPTGTKIAAGQTATLTWNITSAGLPATAFGYNGSFAGINVAYWIGPSWHVAAQDTGSQTFDLSGLLWSVQGGYTPYLSAVPVAGTTCGSSKAIRANVNAAIPAQNLPDLSINNVFLTDAVDGDLLSMPEPNEYFVINFVIQNTGNAPAGAFSFHAELDDGVNKLDYRFTDGLAAESNITLRWPFNEGLDDGPYVTTWTVDSLKEVKESNEANNTSGTNPFDFIVNYTN